MSALPPPPPPPPPPSYGSPYGQRTMHNYAGFGARLGGHLLDGMLYGLVMLPFAVPAIVFGILSFKDCNVQKVDTNDHTYTTCGPGQFKGGYLALSIVFGIAAVVLVAVLYLRALGRTGQTWGRKIAGVKVVSATDGQPLGIPRAFGRCVVESVVSGNCILGYLWMLWDDQNQTWHDKIIGSVVVRV